MAYSINLPIIFAKYILQIFKDPQLASRIVSGLTMGFMGITGFLVSFNFTKNSRVSFIIALVAISCESLKYHGSTNDL